MRLPSGKGAECAWLRQLPVFQFLNPRIFEIQLPRQPHTETLGCSLELYKRYTPAPLKHDPTMHIMLFLLYSLVGIGDVIITTMNYYALIWFHMLSLCFWNYLLLSSWLGHGLQLVAGESPHRTMALRIVASETGLEDLPRDLEKHLAALEALGWSCLKGIRIPSPILFVRSPKPCSSFPRWIFKILAWVDSGNLAGSCRNSLIFLLLYGQNARFP